MSEWYVSIIVLSLFASPNRIDQCTLQWTLIVLQCLEISDEVYSK